MTHLGPLMSSVRGDWNTPGCVLERVRRVAPIDLDPCSNAASIVNAAVEWHLERDGDSLRRDWMCTPGLLIYVNPPYGRDIGTWVARCAGTAIGIGPSAVVALIPARTDTAWWHRYATTADAICFWRGRLTFLGAAQGAPVPSAVAYWGPCRATFRREFCDAGWIVKP